MGLDLWFPEDVARILASAHETARSFSLATGSQGTPVGDAYQQGFADALRSVAVAFGVGLQGVPDQASQNRPAWNEQTVDGNVLGSWIRTLDPPG